MRKPIATQSIGQNGVILKPAMEYLFFLEPIFSESLRYILQARCWARTRATPEESKFQKHHRRIFCAHKELAEECGVIIIDGAQQLMRQEHFVHQIWPNVSYRILIVLAK